MNFLENLLNYKITDDRDLKNKKLSIDHFKENGPISFDRKFFQDGHFTASGIVFNKNKTHILLTHHKFLNIWIQLGGHIDQTDKSVAKAALRECKEESGIDKIELINHDIFDIDIHHVPENNKKNELQHIHYDIRYLLISNEDNFVVSEESHDLKWIEIEKVCKIINLEDIGKKISINSL